MSGQLAMEFGVEIRASECWKRFLDALDRAVLAIGTKEVVERLDVQPSVLSESLEPDDPRKKRVRHFQARWLPMVLLLAPEINRREVLTELASVAGYDLSKKKILTPAEELAELKERVRSQFGPMGERVINEVGR